MFPFTSVKLVTGPVDLVIVLVQDLTLWHNLLKRQ